MNVEITGRHIVVTPPLRAYIMRRLRKFNRMVGDDASIHVIIDVEKTRHTAEITLKSKLLDLAGKGQTADMYASILLAIDKLERQALKQKSRIIETRRQLAKAKSLEEKTGVATIRRPGSDRQAKGIAIEELEHKPMTAEEAALELDQSKYPFVVYRDAESGATHVLYRRKNGTLAVICS